MKNIVRGRKKLAEIHTKVSKALNLILSKIEISGNQNNAAMKDYVTYDYVTWKQRYDTYTYASTIYRDNLNHQFEI